MVWWIWFKGSKRLDGVNRNGLHIELVEKREGFNQNNWSFGKITPEVAIKGFGGATLFSAHPKQTGELMEKVMGLERVGTEGNIVQFRSKADR